MDSTFFAVLIFLAAGVTGYLLGSINFGIVVSQLMFHEDVRTKGSKNAGTTNVLRVYGKKAAAFALFGDLGKGVVAVFVGQWLVASLVSLPSIAPYGGYAAAIGALCGHLWPLWFNFKGGKGVAVAAGIILAVQPMVLLALAIVFFTLFFITRIVSVCSITVAALYPVFTALWFWYKGEPMLVPVLCAVFIGGLVIWMHRANIERLKNGTEYKFGQKKEEK